MEIRKPFAKILKDIRKKLGQKLKKKTQCLGGLPLSWPPLQEPGQSNTRYVKLQILDDMAPIMAVESWTLKSIDKDSKINTFGGMSQSK